MRAKWRKHLLFASVVGNFFLVYVRWCTGKLHQKYCMIDKSSLSRVSQDQSGSQPNQKPNDSNGKPAKTWENNPPCRAEMNRVIGLKQHRFRAPAASLPVNVKTYAGSNHNLLKQGTGAADHPTLFALFLVWAIIYHYVFNTCGASWKRAIETNGHTQWKWQLTKLGSTVTDVCVTVVFLQTWHLDSWLKMLCIALYEISDTRLCDVTMSSQMKEIGTVGFVE